MNGPIDRPAGPPGQSRDRSAAFFLGMVPPTAAMIPATDPPELPSSWARLAHSQPPISAEADAAQTDRTAPSVRVCPPTASCGEPSSRHGRATRSSPQEDRDGRGRLESGPGEGAARSRAAGPPPGDDSSARPGRRLPSAAGMMGQRHSSRSPAASPALSPSIGRPPSERVVSQASRLRSIASSRPMTKTAHGGGAAEDGAGSARSPDGSSSSTGSARESADTVQSVATRARDESSTGISSAICWRPIETSWVDNPGSLKRISKGISPAVIDAGGAGSSGPLSGLWTSPPREAGTWKRAGPLPPAMT